MLPTNTMPKVSIIIPTYNRVQYLERCILSCLEQSFPDLEVIVMDGGSKDGSVKLLEKLKARDSRLSYVSQPDGGEVYAVNAGITRIRGSIYGIQASDDYYLPGAVKKAVEFLDSNSEYIGVAGDALFIGGDGNSMGRGMITCRRHLEKKNIKQIMMNRLGGFLPHGSFFGRKIIFEKIGLFDPAYSVTSDFEFYLRLLSIGERIGCIPEPLLHYRIHEEMGARKYRQEVIRQNRKLQIHYGFRLLDRIYHSSVGRLVSYCENPYRTPLPQKLLQLLGK